MRIHNERSLVFLAKGFMDYDPFEEEGGTEQNSVVLLALCGTDERKE
jgi:hypothetical protein